MKIILASKSPRRMELLKMCSINFSVESSDLDEGKIKKEIFDSNVDKDIYEISSTLVEKLAHEKAKDVFNKNLNKDEDLLVIGSDTVVTSKEKILGKPRDEEDARMMLKNLCGKTHRVYTGVSMITHKKTYLFHTMTEVVFHDFDEFMNKTIEDYIKTSSPMDKAGGYGIQDMGALLVKEIHGDYYTVMGLPVSDVVRKIYELENI